MYPNHFYWVKMYVSVDDKNDVEFFYYFVKSENNPVEDPLILWLTGGPACSTITAFAMELGPVLFKRVKYDESLPSLELNPYSWTKFQFEQTLCWWRFLFWNDCSNCCSRYIRW
ncbi:sinapoylglucose--choline O-sinapoyltransferase [Ranunculus cassubicifolius]